MPLSFLFVELFDRSFKRSFLTTRFCSSSYVSTRLVKVWWFQKLISIQTSCPVDYVPLRVHVVYDRGLDPRPLNSLSGWNRGHEVRGMWSFPSCPRHEDTSLFCFPVKSFQVSTTLFPTTYLCKNFSSLIELLLILRKFIMDCVIE